MSSTIERAGVVPAALSFLTIYNPSLSDSDETFQDQIVYYYAKPTETQLSKPGKANEDEAVESKEEKNQKLRQVGLAQGMVGFAKYTVFYGIRYIMLRIRTETFQTANL